MHSLLKDMAPIRAIAARFSYNYSRATLETIFTELPFEYCASISFEKNPLYLSGLSDGQQDWFVSSEVRNCHYEGVDWNDLLPLDAQIIKDMFECEAVFMDLVNRLEWKQEVTYEVRKQQYYRHLRFWNDYISRHKINFYISAWIPHEIPDVIIYYLCKARGIPVLYLHTCTVRDISFIEEDINLSADCIHDRYTQLCKDYATQDNPDVIQLSKALEQRFVNLANPKGEKPPVESVKRLTYWQKVRGLASGNPLAFLRYLCLYCTPKGIRRASNAWRRWRRMRATKKYYDKHAIRPDMKADFIYMPLHFQPEASTNPMGGAYNDQLLVAAMLNSCVPKNVFIYVKEHPRKSGWLARSPDYYAELVAMKHVRLIAQDVDTFELREQCTAVATVTGSAGFEALFREKPVLLFGHRFYMYADGVFPIHSEEDCTSAIEAIYVRGEKPTLMQGKLLLKAMEDTGVSGVMDPWKMKVTHLPEAAHIQAVSIALISKIKELSVRITAV